MTGSVTVPRPILLCNSTNTVRATDRLAFSWGLGLLFERATADGGTDVQSIDRARRVRHALGDRATRHARSDLEQLLPARNVS